MADSEPASRESLALTLRMCGFQPFEAGDANEAIDVMSSIEVHGLVLDSDLPEIGGLETIRVIRAFHRVPPFLLLANTLIRELHMAALDWRATTVLPRPVDSWLFTDMVHRMLVREYGNM